MPIQSCFPKIAQAIRQLRGQILTEWEGRVRKEVDAAAKTGHISLLDSLPNFLEELARNLEKNDVSLSTGTIETAVEHGEQRASNPAYSLSQMLIEYRILRETLIANLSRHEELDLSRELLAFLHQFLDVAVEKAGLSYEKSSTERISQQESEIRTEQSNIRALFKETSVIFALMKGPEHRFEYVNPAHMRLLGKDATGKTLLEVQPEAKPGGMEALLDKVFQEGVSIDLNETGFPVGDDFRYFDFTYVPHFDIHKKVDGVLTLANDITEAVRARKRIEESNRRLERLETQLSEAVKISKTGFYDWNISRDFVIYSEQMKADWGLIGDTPIRDALALIHADDRVRVVKLIEEAMLKKTPFLTEYRVIRPFDQQTVWIQAQGQVDFDESDQPTRFFGTSVNVTERKTVEQNLTDAVQSRDEFLSIASHELKTPLTSMQLQIQTARRKVERGGPSAFDAHQFLRLVNQTERSLKRLTRLVDDMLDISRISSGKLTLSIEPFDLGELAREVVERLTPLAATAGVTLSIHAENVAEGEWDRFRIDQVITNLLTNAIKYGECSPVEVSVSKTSEIATLQVRDFGPGIAHENLERVFGRFERVSVSDGISGLGLGLHICREIINRHQGKIFVESALGQGSAFVVELPVSALANP